MPICLATNKSKRVVDTSADEILCRLEKPLIADAYVQLVFLWSEAPLANRSSALPLLSPRHQKLFHAVDGRSNFVLLYRSCGIDVLGTDFGALAYERASPDPLGMREHCHSLRRSLIA